MIIALGMFLPILVNFVETGLVSRFPTLIVSTVLGFSAMLSTACGLILDTIANNAGKSFELQVNVLKILLRSESSK